jgi:LDH2 family malate/lactate/ureidoglycolate dehydrogenase
LARKLGQLQPFLAVFPQEYTGQSNLEWNNGCTKDNLTPFAPQGAIPIVTPIGGDKPTIGSNAIAIAMETGSTSPGR